MAPFHLAHLSDPHLSPLPRPRLMELAGKRVFGYLNWRRNRHRFHRRDVLDALIADIKAREPDHIAITGDIVNLALEAEFAPARAWLDNIGPPEQVTIIPGNHDRYVRATARRFATAFAPFLRPDQADAPEGFPSLRRRGPVALISLSSAIPTAPLMATGRVGAAQLAALEPMLENLRDEEAFRILLIHHPLRSTAAHKRLSDAAALCALIRRHGVELILHGHDHRHATSWIETGHGRIPVVGVPSASAIAHGRIPAAAYNLFAIDRAASGWRCDHSVHGFCDGPQIRTLAEQRLT
ncbi:MAG: metallophosphoesterase [Alphaproteobacteria bacterium]|nr:metallophosphoesterase [Alphaproteobacteria bacterium]